MTSQISSLKTYKFTPGASKLQPARRPPISVQHYIISQSEHGINVGSRELSCRIHCASDFLLLLSPAVLSAEKIAKFIWTFSTVQIESPAEYWPCLHFKATAVVVHGLLCDISSSKFPPFCSLDPKEMAQTLHRLHLPWKPVYLVNKSFLSYHF